MAAGRLHADDIPVPVLAPGRLWTYARDDRPAADSTPAAVWFAYLPDRKGEHPQFHLRNFTGTLQADGYAGFDRVYEAGRVREAACWAHAILLAATDLGECYACEKRYADQEKMLREVLPIQRRVLGPEHPDTLLTMNGLADSLKN